MEWLLGQAKGRAAQGASSLAAARAYVRKYLEGLGEYLETQLEAKAGQHARVWTPHFVSDRRMRIGRVSRRSRSRVAYWQQNSGLAGPVWRRRRRRMGAASGRCCRTSVG